ncbi:MAG: insulinase family protein, partial [Acidobacteria bacterium]|nr:insulinase family protein [Acidobacteriota bacterium]
MKPRLISLTLAAAVALSAQSIPASYKDLKFGPLNPVKVPKIERFTLPNGIRVLLVEDHELPFFNARAFIPGGENQDPADKVGLAAITLGAMRTGGSTSKSGDDLDKELDRLPATVETSSDDDANAAVVSSLKENSARVLEILSGLLRNPAFLQEKIDLEKTQIRAGIERRNEDTMGIAYRETARLLFGKDSPKARQVEYAHLDAIQREDVLAYHKANIQPDHMMLGVWGDFDSASMRALITKTFGSWPRGGRPKPPALKVDLAAQSKGVYLANKDDVTQSWIQVSHLVDMLPSHPDYPAMTVAMNVLGGGFGSRMFNNIRTTEGLAY